MTTINKLGTRSIWIKFSTLTKWHFQPAATTIILNQLPVDQTQDHVVAFVYSIKYVFTVKLLGSLLVVEVGGLLPDPVLGQLLGQLLPADVSPGHEEVAVLKAGATVVVGNSLKCSNHSRFTSKRNKTDGDYWHFKVKVFSLFKEMPCLAGVW